MSQKGLKGCGLLLLSMESIPEAVAVKIIGCSSCKVLKGEGFFIRCDCGPGPRLFFKTCKLCRDAKARSKAKVKAYKAFLLDPPPADDFGPCPPPPGVGL